jgi:Zn2+/Cd2+-exporting ATPase
VLSQHAPTRHGSEGRGISAGQEIVTGESEPVQKDSQAAVFAGSTIYDGTVAVRATHSLGQSTPARIAEVAASALRDKAPVESMLNRVTRRWSQAVLGGALVALAVLLTAGVPLLGPRGAIYRALGLLTAGAPCALLMVPLTFVCAVSVLARYGVLVRGAAVLDSLQKIRHVGLDKTGTLTQGVTCTEIRVLTPSSHSEVSAPLAVAAALSLRASHPIAKAVLRQHQKEEHAGNVAVKRQTADSLAAVDGFSSVSGAGVAGIVAGQHVLFGTSAHVAPGLSLDARLALDRSLNEKDPGRMFSILVQTPIDVAGDGNGSKRPAPQVTLFTFSDVAKVGSATMIAQLRQRSLSVCMLTGDNATSANAMAESMGLSAASEVRADMQPADKAAWVAEQQRSGGAVLMMGDGLNDAPALAQADVGVAVASSADSLAADVAGVVLLSSGNGFAAFENSVTRLVFLLNVARAARRIVLQNLGIAIAAMLVAAIPAVSGLVPLWLAVALHEGSSVLVALNSCRLLVMRPQPVL